MVARYAVAEFESLIGRLSTKGLGYLGDIFGMGLNPS